MTDLEAQLRWRFIKFADIDGKIKHLQGMGYCRSIYQLPEHMHQPIVDYLLFGLEPGGFMSAVLENDLVGAVGRADWMNERKLKEWALFVYNDIPSTARNIQQWIGQGGMAGPISKLAEADRSDDTGD